jgi:hypothetical protein
VLDEESTFGPGFPVAVSTFSVGGSLFSMSTSPILGTTTDLQVSLSLEYEEAQSVYLTVVSGPLSEVTASFATEVGPETVMLGPSPMPLDRIVGL